MASVASVTARSASSRARPSVSCSVSWSSTSRSFSASNDMGVRAPNDGIKEALARDSLSRPRVPTTPPLPTHDHYLGTSRFASLDGLRCLAVIPVVWHHATPWPPPGLLGRGPLGVDLFFAISGFLITTLLLRERRTYGVVAVGRFYARRALRIFPAYYVVLGLTALRAVAWMPAGPVRDHFLRSLPYWATYTANWFVDFDVGHAVIFAFAWSLATEEQFYAVWPWLARAPRWVMPVAALALLALHEGMLRGCFGADWPPLGRRMIASLAPGICMGALLACALDARRGFAAFAHAIGARIAAPIAFLVLVVVVANGRAPFLAVV